MLVVVFFMTMILEFPILAQEGVRRPVMGPTREMVLSVDEFTDIAIRKSLRAKVYKNSLESVNAGWQINYRSLRYPQLNLNASGNRSSSHGLTGKSFSEAADVKLNLNQPLYWSGGSLDVKGSRSDSLTESGGFESTSRTEPAFEVSYTQPLFIFVKDSRKRSWRRAMLDYQTSLESLELERLSIWAEARRLYYQAILRQSVLQVEKKSLGSSKAVLEMTRILVKSGKYAPVELGRAEIRFRRKERGVRNAETTLLQTQNQVISFLQLEPGTPIKLSTRLSYQPFRKTLSKLLAYALAHRQDYLNAVRALELGQISLAEAEEENNPKLSLTSSYSTDKNFPNPGAAYRNNAWSILGSVSWPIFDSEINRLRVRQNLIDIDNKKIALESTKQAIEVAVENAYLDIKRLEEQISDFDVSLKQVQENSNNIKLRYRYGLDRLIDVFDAENELRELELEYLGLLVNFHTSKDQLVLTLGGSLEDMP